VNVCVYVEGGGPKAKSQTATACRKAFHLFFEKVLGERSKPRIVASGSRDEAYDDFCRSLKADPNSFAILIVDSEDPVPSGKTAVAHLRDREKHWTKLVQTSQVGLMVQCMEAWFLADRSALVGYYGAELKLSALPGNPKIEQIPKRDVMTGLENATRATQKGLYHKTKHGFDLLGLIDPNMVIKSSPFADELVKLLLAKSA
jgi:hypothetical protein